MYHFSGNEKKDIGCCAQLFRSLLVLINLIFFLASAAIAVLSIILRINRHENIVSFCTVCQHVDSVAIALFIVMALLSLCAVYGLMKRDSCLLKIYAIYLVVLFFASLALSIAIVLFHEGHFEGQIHSAWTNVVREEPAEICTLETTLSCSGYNILCNDTFYYNSSVYNASTNPNVDCAPCFSSPQIASYNQTCSTALQSTFAKYYKAIVITGFSIVAVCLISFIVTVQVMSHPSYEEIGHRNAL